MTDIVAGLAALTTYQVLDEVLVHANERRAMQNALQTALLSQTIQGIQDRVEEQYGEEEDAGPGFANAALHQSEPTPEWEQYVGQRALKNRLRVAIASAKARGCRLDHVLLASGMPGVGKTAMARIIAKEMGGQIVELVPKFTIQNLIAAAQSLDDGDVLFIDEVHKMAENGKKGAEILLKLLEDHVIYLDGEAIEVADITVVAATTDLDMLPETIVDRFKIKPYFERYTLDELAAITSDFTDRHGFDWDPDVDDDLNLIYGIAQASRSTPRVCEEFVLAARDLQVTMGRQPTIKDVLAFQQVEPDGMTRQHIAYLTNMLKYNKRTVKNRVEWIAGEAVMMSMLRETKQGIQRIERFLMEQGYIDRTPSGRRLTPAGIQRARAYLKRGLA